MGTVTMLGRLLISLAFVLGVMWLIARKVGGRRGLRGGGRTKLIDVLGRHQLFRGSSVAIVQVLDQALIVGITDGHVSVLGETDLAAVKKRLAENQAPVPARPKPRSDKGKLNGSALSPATWRQTVDSLRELTVRTK